ncbi:MAG TPA: hypothetical protein VGU68_09285, partial [Ktedonobacteraceae bacterium]|nr:hypothetical protein [Ktedonobacteraceae bacterium]
VGQETLSQAVTHLLKELLHPAGGSIESIVDGLIAQQRDRWPVPEALKAEQPTQIELALPSHEHTGDYPQTQVTP